MRLTHKLSGCEDKTCPAVWATDDPEMVAVQGTLPGAVDLDAAGEIPGHEELVLIPTQYLRDWAVANSGLR